MIMNWYTDAIGKRLTDQHIAMLRNIHEPTYVTIPPDNARRQSCVLPNGIIRQYSVGGYNESCNGGLSWKFHAAPANCLGAAVRNPDSGRYCTVVVHEDGTYAHLSDVGPDDTEYRMIKITEQTCMDMFQPIYLQSRKRWVVTMSGYEEPSKYHPVVAYSDDDGESWQTVDLQPAPDHRPVFPDKGVRWQNAGSEPVCTELPDGSLFLLARTSQDHLWQYRSEDGGKTWSNGTCSPFHATLTTPYLLKLSDGRILLFWCNTIPMPEENHRVGANMFDFHERGESEDVFTNRDVCHAAISDDGIHWRGMREIKLSPIRNAADYRYIGERGDKSMQQFQALELPQGRILVDIGQNPACRRTVIFSLDWLLETDRYEDFQDGIQYLTTHLYRKSVSGSTCFSYTVGNKKMNGHCAWNRADGAMPVIRPDIPDREVLQINRYHDERLYNELQGAVWNFPAAMYADIRIKLWIGGAGLRISLCDHWLNACDPSVSYRTNASFTITEQDIPKNCWRELLIRYDAQAGIVRVYDQSFLDAAENLLPGGILTSVRFRQTAPLGISYLHLQTLAECADPIGSYIWSMQQIALEQSPFTQAQNEL